MLATTVLQVLVVRRNTRLPPAITPLLELPTKRHALQALMRVTTCKHLAPSARLVTLALTLVWLLMKSIYVKRDFTVPLEQFKVFDVRWVLSQIEREIPKSMIVCRAQLDSTVQMLLWCRQLDYAILDTIAQDLL
jgi:hypothetical protein